MAEDLRENKVEVPEAKIYAAIYIFFILWGITESVGWYMQESSTIREALIPVIRENLFMLIFILISVLIAWHANGNGVGQRFWYRFFSLQMPISIWTTILSIFAFQALITIFYPESFNSLIAPEESVGFILPPDAATWAVQGVIMAVSLYWTWKYMRIVAHKKA